MGRNCDEFAEKSSDLCGIFDFGYCVVLAEPKRNIGQLLERMRRSADCGGADATDAEYAKAAQTKYNDERNNYLANKAAALTVRWGLLALAIMVFILQIAGYKAYSTLLGFVVCALLVVYYVSYMYLKKKY